MRYKKRAKRSGIKGSSQRPRLSVFKSLHHIVAQLIDDDEGKTLAYASSLKSAKKGSKTEKAKEVGKVIAELGKKAKIHKVVFDRGNFIYHGRIKALADSARENGLEY